MKKPILIVVFIITAFSARAQSADSLKVKPAHSFSTDTINQLKDAPQVFTLVDNMPEFPGGLQQFYAYIAKNIRYPPGARASKTQGRVIISMIIERDGAVAEVKVIKSASRELDAEAVRVVSSSPKWNPGIQNGAAVRVQFAIPISFSLK